LTGTLALGAACAEAGGEVVGGELTDAGALAFERPVFTGVNIGSGSKWSDLYRDIFSPIGRPGSCAYTPNCHGSPDGAGAKARGGIQCFDQAGCRQSLIDKNQVRTRDAAAPDNAPLLIGLLRIKKPDGTIVGFMPKEPSSFAFPEKSLERIRAWIANGIPDD
jgi:hypothetical protein